MSLPSCSAAQSSISLLAGGKEVMDAGLSYRFMMKAEGGGISVDVHSLVFKGLITHYRGLFLEGREITQGDIATESQAYQVLKALVEAGKIEKNFLMSESCCKALESTTKPLMGGKTLTVVGLNYRFVMKIEGGGISVDVHSLLYKGLVTHYRELVLEGVEITEQDIKTDEGAYQVLSMLVENKKLARQFLTSG
jgi:hypothetical protein